MSVFVDTGVFYPHHDTDALTKAEKITAVLVFAQNKAGDDGKVAVTPAEIRGCTGVSRRYFLC